MPWQDRFPDREAFHAEVKRLVLERGLSYSRAAAVIGHGTTKNAVVRAMQTILGRTRSTVTFPDSVGPSTTKIPTEKAIEIPEVPVHLERVRDGQCRAPLWPDFLRSAERAAPAEHMLCGHPVKAGSAYCADHHEIFYPAELQQRVIKPKQNSEVKDNSRHFG